MSHPAQEQQDSAADFSQAPLQQQPNGHLAAGDPDRLAGRAVAVKAEPVAVKREAFPQPAQASDAQPAQQLPPTFAKGAASLGLETIQFSRLPCGLCHRSI